MCVHVFAFILIMHMTSLSSYREITLQSALIACGVSLACTIAVELMYFTMCSDTQEEEEEEDEEQ